MLEKIDTLAESNPKQSWKLVNSNKKSQFLLLPEGNNKISSSEWYEYFKNLNKDVNLYSVESNTETKIVKDFNRWAVQCNDILDRPILNDAGVMQNFKKIEA